MGNCLRAEDKKSNEPKEKNPQANEQSNQHVVKKSAEPKSWDIRRQKLNLADYQFMNKTDETLVKAPGSINGEQFVVDSCTNCTIYLCDTTATVLVDDCENCKFYIGPCASSVFIRKMKNCQLIIACQQLRTRDCEDLDIMLFSQTPPVIESSNNLRFGCFKFGYFELQQQFQKIELNIWNNRWSEIFDFTKKKSKNFSFLPEDIDPYDLIPRISTLPGGEFSDPTSEEVDLLVPITTGDRPKLYDEEILFVLAPGYENAAEQMIPEINKQSDFEMIKARSFALTQEYLQQIPSAEQAIIKRLIDTHQVKLGKDNFIFINFGGKSLSEILYPLLGRVFTDKKSYHIWSNNKVTTELNKLIFETFREGE